MPRHALTLDSELDGPVVAQDNARSLPLGPEPVGMADWAEFAPVPGGGFPGPVPGVGGQSPGVKVSKRSGWARQFRFKLKMWRYENTRLFDCELEPDARLKTYATTSSFIVVRSRIVLGALSADADARLLDDYRAAAEELMACTIFLDVTPFGAMVDIAAAHTVETEGHGPVCLEALREDGVELIKAKRGDGPEDNAGWNIDLPASADFGVFIQTHDARQTEQARGIIGLLKTQPPAVIFPGRLLLLGMQTMNLGALAYAQPPAALLAPWQGGPLVAVPIEPVLAVAPALDPVGIQP